MDKASDAFNSMMTRLQQLDAEVTLHLSGGGVAKSKGKALRWNPNEEMLQIGDYTYVDVASIVRVDIQHL